MLDPREILALGAAEQGGGQNAKFTPEAKRLLEIADRLGGRSRYFWQGFMPNKRQVGA